MIRSRLGRVAVQISAAVLVGVLAAAGLVYAQGVQSLSTLVSTYRVPITTPGAVGTDTALSTLKTFINSGGTAGAGAFTTLTASSTLGVTGVTTPTGGVAAAGGFSVPTAFSTGNVVPQTTTTGTDTTPVVTETYVNEVFIPANTTITGIALLNGSAVAGNVRAFLANSAGTVVASSAAGGTAQSGTAAYQQFALSTPYAAVGPAKYYVAVQFNNTSARYRSQILGQNTAGKITSTVFDTLASFTPPTTFTTNLGPIASTY